MGLVEFAATLREMHAPIDEEAEVWADNDSTEALHDERFPDCTDCEGHTVTMPVCHECGYSHDGDMPLFRAWPCPTVTALDRLLTA